MKKLLALVLAVVMMLGITSVAFAETAATDSLQAVLDAGVLKVGVDATFAPLTFKDADGNLVGYDIDLATAAAAKLGLTVEFVEIADWSALDTLLADGTVDCVWSGLTITADRKASMTLSDAYLADTTSLMVAEGVTTLEELADKAVAVQAGSSTEELLSEPEFADFCASVTVIGTDTYETAFAALTATEVAEAPSSDDALVPVDAVLISGLVASYNITANEALAGYTVIENLASDYIGIAFAKGNYKLCGAVEEALCDLAQDGTVADITTKWFGSDISLIDKTAAEGSSLDAVVNAGVLKVGVDAAFAPMTFKDETGNYTGYDVELAAAVAAKLGVAVEFVEVDWANLGAALADGTIDCVWSGMSINDDRLATMTVSDAYLESDTVILVNDEVAGFIEDLEGKMIAVQGGSFAEELLKGLVPAESIVTFATSDEAIAAMLKKAAIDASEKAAKYEGQAFDRAAATEGLVLADAVMLDSTYAAYQIASNDALADFIMIEELYADLFGIGFAKGDCLLCGAVEEALYELAEEGTVASITATWFGEDVSLIGK